MIVAVQSESGGFYWDEGSRICLHIDLDGLNLAWCQLHALIDKTCKSRRHCPDMRAIAESRWHLRSLIWALEDELAKHPPIYVPRV